MIRKAAIFSKDNNTRTRNGVQNLIDEFCKRGILIQLYQNNEGEQAAYSGEIFQRFSDFKDLAGKPDMVFSVGGDGTFLDTVQKVKDSGVPVAGVNTGRMGFLANIPGEEISRSIDLLCRDEFEIIERSLLQLIKPAGILAPESAEALNEISIQKSGISMITISVYVNEAYLNTYWADGLIMSTATGSTAYNLSVGGPILSPGDESIIISPISPHNLTIRPIVLSGNSRFRMLMEARSDEFIVTCDNRYRKLPLSEEVIIEKAGTKLRTVMLKEMDFYSTLRNKLMWGADKRN